MGNKYYFISRYVDIMTEVTDLFKNLNINESECAPSDIKRVLRWISTSRSDEAMKLITRFMHMGASLYTVGIHLNVLRFLTRNQQVWKKKALAHKSDNKHLMKWAKNRHSKIKDIIPVIIKGMVDGRKKKSKKTVLFTDSDDEVLSY